MKVFYYNVTLFSQHMGVFFGVIFNYDKKGFLSCIGIHKSSFLMLVMNAFHKCFEPFFPRGNEVML